MIIFPLPFQEKLAVSNNRMLDQNVVIVDSASTSHRGVKGVNSRMDMLTLSWVGLSLSELLQLKEFWKDHGKTAAWAYGEIDEDVKSYIFSDMLNVETFGCDAYNVSTSAMQVFDSIQGVAIPTPTPTISLTPSVSVSATITPTPTPTATITPSSTAAVTPTPTLTPTISLTPDVTVTPGLSVSVTPTYTPTATATPSPTPEVTGTPAVTPTSTVTSTPAVTSTVTPTVTTTATPTVTPTKTTTPTPTTSVTPSITPSASPVAKQIFVGGNDLGVQRLSLDGVTVVNNDISGWIDPVISAGPNSHTEVSTALAINVPETKLYFPNGSKVGVVNINTNTMESNLDLGVTVKYVAYDSAYHQLWAVTADGATIKVYDLATSTTTTITTPTGYGSSAGLSIGYDYAVVLRATGLHSYKLSDKTIVDTQAFNAGYSIDFDGGTFAVAYRNESYSVVSLYSGNNGFIITRTYLDKPTPLTGVVVKKIGNFAMLTRDGAVLGTRINMIDGTTTTFGLNTVKLIGKDVEANDVILSDRDQTTTGLGRVYRYSFVTNSFYNTITLNNNYGNPRALIASDTFRIAAPVPSTTPSVTPS